MTTLTITEQPVGAKPGQVLLFVDLSTLENASRVIEEITAAGYTPDYRYCFFADGMHLLAILKDQQSDQVQGMPEEQWEALQDEWESLGSRWGDTSVRLWRGHARQPIAA